MKNPLTKEQMEMFLTSLETEEGLNKYLDAKEKRYQNIVKGETLGKEQILEGSIYDLLYSIYRFENADIWGDVNNYNRDFIKQIFNDDVYITLKVNDFVVNLKKPFTLKDIVLVKNTISDLELEDLDNIIALQEALGENLKIFKQDILIKNIGSLGYEDCKIFFFLTPILYNILTLFTNTIGTFSKKKSFA